MNSQIITDEILLEAQGSLDILEKASKEVSNAIASLITANRILINKGGSSHYNIPDIKLAIRELKHILVDLGI